jgi:hypothetical protein
MANEIGAGAGQTRLDDYRGYRGLPPLAGLLSMRDATTTGLTVEESVARLKRIHWALKRLHQIFIARITAMPVYELKMAFSLHGHYCAEHVTEFRNRVREMRQPPYGLDEAPDPNLDVFFDEILCAPDTAALVYGLYAKAVPALVDALQLTMRDISHLFDHPSYRICRLTLLEVNDIADYGIEALKCLVEPADKARLDAWGKTLDAVLAAAGGLDGTAVPSDAPVDRVFSRTPYTYDGFPKRDERFVDSYNMGVNAEALLLDPDVEALPKTIMLYFKRMREIDVPEMMASIIHETPGKPWEYYRDMTRQLWDEARHAMMGELGFASMGIDWTTIPFNFTWSMGLNTKLNPLERHAVLFTIEQGLMPKKTGKEYEWEVAVATANRLTQLIQDYDWADEILHARIGRDWLVKELGSQAQAQAFGSECWSRVLTDWATWRDQGLTQHGNWWPDVYRAACKFWGVEPSPELLAYDKTYENQRADLATVAAE